ncbi:hypothetical protein CTEN210_11796 [Chaetoceros tenuissimus]|uniref:Serine/threonine specific protein phosphatases domain-containing protein n=1 Tax=Chaetoceros tenuissimus TaxID=426638 RepID=A0AAD3D253_9STRA|nr:hypothetical protein CTEN210_11796 [Chaetoceros tenuissimus]
MIAFTFHANLSSLLENDGNFKNANRKQEIHRNTKSNTRKHDGRIDNTTTVIIDAIRKMYNGGHLNREYAKYILLQGRDMMAKLPSFCNVSLPTIDDDFKKRNLSKKRITVVGDIHGNYNNMIHIFRTNGGLPSKDNPYIFNGDLTDKDYQGIQCLLTALLIKVYCNECLHLLRGNHELRDYYNGIMKSQVLRVYDEEIWLIVRDIFNLLPLGIVLDNRILVVHGGIPSANITLNELQSINRTTDEIFHGNMTKDQSLIEELVWAEEDEENGITVSRRGIYFGPDISKEFLQRNNLEYIIKGHTYIPKGFRIAHEGRVVTLHSAPSKLSSRDYGAYANIYSNDGSMHIEQFRRLNQSISIDWRSLVP